MNELISKQANKQTNKQTNLSIKKYFSKKIK